MRQTMENKKVSEEVAQAMIEKTDQYRAEYYKNYTHGKDWTNSINYDMVLNSEKIGIDNCVRLIMDYLKIRQLI